MSHHPVRRGRAWPLLLAVPVLCAAAAVWAQEPTAKPAEISPAVTLDKKIIADAKAHSELMKNLAHLSDVIGPRLTGSAALKKANDWTAEVMKSYGLSNVHLEPWEIPVGWERGTATLKIIEPDNGRSLTVAAAGWTPGTNGKLVGDVVVFRPTTKEDLAAYKGKLKNAIILRGPPANVRPITDNTFPLPGQRPAQGGPGAAPGAPADPAPKAKEADKPAAPMAVRTSIRANTDEIVKPAEQPPKKDAAPAAQPPKKDGDAAAQPPKKDGDQPPGRLDRMFNERFAFQREMADFLRAEGAAVMLSDSGKPHGLLNMTGQWRQGDRANAAEPMPQLFITHDHYALLYRLATRPAPAVTKAEVEITNKFVPGPITVYNTVGEIVGSEKPDEVVVVGAHLDSWDLGTGTTDNGTGTCVVLETARLIAKCGVKPKRTIRFVLFTGEEEGLYGSKAYVTRHKDELAKISAALVHDTGTGKVTGFGLQGRESVKKVLEPELASLVELGFSKELSLRGMGGTDHVSFEGQGVPGFACVQDPDEYRFTHHSQSDTFDKAKEDNLIEGAQVMAVAAMRIANLPAMLPRDKPAGAGQGGFGGGGRQRDRTPPPAEKPADKPADKPKDKE
jgi:hypothetical protein